MSEAFAFCQDTTSSETVFSTTPRSPFGLGWGYPFCVAVDGHAPCLMADGSVGNSLPTTRKPHRPRVALSPRAAPAPRANASSSSSAVLRKGSGLQPLNTTRIIPANGVAIGWDDTRAAGPRRFHEGWYSSMTRQWGEGLKPWPDACPAAKPWGRRCPMSRRAEGPTT